MRLALLKRRDGGDGELLEGQFWFHCFNLQMHISDARLLFTSAAFQSIIDNMTLSESEITEYGDTFSTLSLQRPMDRI